MKLKSKDITLAALFAGLTAVGGFISIPLGPVPITLQTLFVILSGVLLGPKLGALSQIIYMTLGLSGVPIFSGFSGGVQAVLRPSFGFVIGFIFSSYAAGIIVHNNFIHKFSIKGTIYLSSVIGTIIIYIFGIPYMYYILNIIMGKNLSIDAVLKLGLWIFIPGDILKLMVASIIGIKVLPHRYFS